jgi:glycogen operon protein
MLNAYWEGLTFELPPVPPGSDRWRRCVDTSLPSPDDVGRWEEAPVVESATYVLPARTIALVARRAQ